MNKLVIGGIYKHFKGTYHKVLHLAKDSENLKDVVVYTHEGSDEVWVRDLDMFLGEVDHEKYPEVTQKYRFELQEDK